MSTQNKDYYFIRVGSDSGEDVPYSMIIDNRLLFIPIANIDITKNEEYSYEELCQFPTHSKLMNYFGKPNSNKEFINFHLDPFFNFNNTGEFSYGDRTKTKKGRKVVNITKAIALTNLQNTDKEKYIFFLATVITPEKEFLNSIKKLTWEDVRTKQEDEDKQLALIGYFKVKKVMIFDKKHKNQKQIIHTFKHNSHVRRKNEFKECLNIRDKKLIFVLGDKKNSKFLFKNPIILSKSTNNGHYELIKEVRKKYFKNKTKAFGYRAYKFFDKDTLNLDVLLKDIKNRLTPNHK